jgi:hypothetical protein
LSVDSRIFEQTTTDFAFTHLTHLCGALICVKINPSPPTVSTQ